MFYRWINWNIDATHSCPFTMSDTTRRFYYESCCIVYLNNLTKKENNYETRMR